MKKLIGLALFTMLAFAMVSSVPAYADWTSNQTLVGELELANNTLNENARRMKQAQDCPAPNPETGFTWVTYIPASGPIVGKEYMVATYDKIRWNTDIFVTRNQLFEAMASVGFEISIDQNGEQKYNSRPTGWVFSKWIYK